MYMESDISFADISDIHANYEALIKALSVIKKRNVDKIVCLGDIIGYGPNPNECLAIVKKELQIVIMGNHEEAMKSVFHCRGNMSEISNIWTKKELNTESWEYIDGIKRTDYKWNGMGFYHSLKDMNEEWIYLNGIDDIVTLFGNREEICFYGHTHRPRITLKSKENGFIKDIRIKRGISINVDTEKYEIYVNPGSIGQQRDNRTDLSFAICKKCAGQLQVTIERHYYNSFKTYYKVKKYGCGDEVAEYLVREDWRRILYSVFERIKK